MTEHEKSSAVVEETRETVDTTSQPETTDKTVEKKNGSNKTSLTLSVIAIAIALAAGVGLYGLVKKQGTNQTATSDALVNQITALQKAQETQKAELEGVIKQQAAALADANSKREELTKQLSEVQEKVATISGTDAKTWLLSQADFLVKLAGRKLWSDQDVTTAAALLKSADASLADMNDPSLINARRAITEDIASLSAVSQVDYDGIILKVNQLSNQIDNLQLADNNDDDSPMDSDGTELSSSLSEWRINLQKSWQNFMDSFITIRRRDETAVPLLAPNQDVYLRENIRSRLLVAAQAVPRHQEETYKQALDNVSTWVRAYYDTNDATTTAFLEDIDKLSQQNITMNVPDKLESQPILEKIMQTRVRNLLAQPGVPAERPAEAPAAAPAAAKPQAVPNAKTVAALVSPVTGEVIAIEQVPDEAFASKAVGDGVAVKPTEKTVVSPAAGTIVKIFNTNHAFCLETENGAEIVVHMGIDTVALNGQGFTRLVEEGAEVAAGQPILEMDLEFLNANARSMISPVVCSNIDDFSGLVIQAQGQVVAGQTPLYEIKGK